MRSIPRAFSNVAILTLCLAMVACATPTRTVLTTDASGHAGSTFSNFLVIGVANDYEGVSPGSPNMPAHLAAPPGEAVVTWPAARSPRFAWATRNARRHRLAISPPIRPRPRRPDSGSGA